jgi:hypothetical protein
MTVIAGLVRSSDISASADLHSWSECSADSGIRFEAGAADQINAIRHRCKDGVEAGLDCCGLAGKIDDE